MSKNKFTGSLLFELREKLIEKYLHYGGVARYDMGINGVDVYEW